MILLILIISMMLILKFHPLQIKTRKVVESKIGYSSIIRLNVLKDSLIVV
ncbi:hypothetical protein BLA29_013333 [Euroglyphus maynei]|uniref:Uncharacterized protein n=1 Tax=Euroglyphus maynei TaxID=6958 RepID=A0A1Y3BFQ2_EURMA|nr:hypothetical protein BLA29_013333 [Euroglyphus maynei]